MPHGCALSRRSFTALSAGAAAAACIGGAGADDLRSVVVELFTSQGCSACPPADALLGEVSRLPGVIALSLNVDYWDYLGWRDTLGSPDCARRQRDYAMRRGDGHVYTPQVIVNGKVQMVGSNRQAILDAVAQEAARDYAASVSVSFSGRGPELLIDIAEAATNQPRQASTVWVVMVIPKVSVEIARGENAGRTVTYTNVVRKIIPAGMWHGERMTLSLPKAAILNDISTACAALLQVDGMGPIIGADWTSGDGV